MVDVGWPFDYYPGITIYFCGILRTSNLRGCDPDCFTPPARVVRLSDIKLRSGSFFSLVGRFKAGNGAGMVVLRWSNSCLARLPLLALCFRRLYNETLIAACCAPLNPIRGL